MMTEKQRKAEFENEFNWLPASEKRFPRTEGVRVTCFEFWGVTFYRQDIYTHTTIIDHEAGKLIETVDWVFDYWFILDETGTIRDKIGKGEALAMMKEAEKKEFEHEQVEENADASQR